MDIIGNMLHMQEELNPKERKPGPPVHWSYYVDPKDPDYIDACKRMDSLIAEIQWDCII